MLKRIIIVMFISAFPLQAMFYRTATKATRKKPVTAARISSYQKNLATKKFATRASAAQKNEPIVQQSAAIPVAKVHESPLEQKAVIPSSVPPSNKKPIFTQLTTRSKWSWGALAAALGLGWLWYNSTDEEQAKEDAENVLKISRISQADPLDRFAQFVKKYGDGAVADQLFEQMVQDSSILWKMSFNAMNRKQFPTSVVPFIKRHYFTLALSENGSQILAHLMNTDAQSKKQLAEWAVRDMEKLCKEAETDNFFVKLMVDNPEAVNSFVQKVKGHVEELITTKAGKQFIDNNLIEHSTEIATERALLLADPSKEFDLRAFNDCMIIIKDNPAIEKKIKESYKKDDFHSLLRKIVYQK